MSIADELAKANEAAFPGRVCVGHHGSEQTPIYAHPHGMSLRDYFAAHALGALIAKAPFLDREGVYGKQAPQSDIDEFTAAMAASAYAYADAVLVERAKERS